VFGEKKDDMMIDLSEPEIFIELNVELKRVVEAQLRIQSNNAIG
jgi:hypothetical protein